MDIILNLLHQGFSAIVPFVVLLGILIFVHELGHFLVAIWCGVRVEVFSLGFGKKIFKFTRGETTYALSIIPLGGYVKMFGEQPGTSISDEDKKFAFTHKNVWQRVAIVLAGPIMNFLFAILVFFTVAMIGEDARTPVLGDIAADSSAYSAGFRSGDKLISVNDLKIQTWEEFQKVLNQKNGNDVNLNFVLQHEGSTDQSKISVVAKAEVNPNILSMYSHVANVPGLTTMAAGTTIGLDEKSRLYAMGLRTGDTITSINGHRVTYWRDLNTTLAKIDPKEVLSLEILGIREGDKVEKPLTITMSPDDSLKSYSLENLGLESSELYLSKVMESSPAEAAGLKQMDRLVSINNIKLTKWEDVINNIKSFDGKNPVSISVLRDKKIVDLKITPKMTTQMTPGGSEEKRYTIGIAPLVNLAAQNFVLVKIGNPLLALARGAERTWDVSIMTVMSFVRLFEAKISPKNIGGVLSIGQAASETFKMGLSQFLQMMAVISVNLFVLNLLPIPVLDGGHLVFYIVEIIKGAPLSLKKMEIAQQVGMALLMSLMVFALFNDFARLFGK